jgi:hypothetical protein
MGQQVSYQAPEKLDASALTMVARHLLCRQGFPIFVSYKNN